MTIHQFVDTIVPADAISNYVLQIQSLLSDLGMQSKIYAKISLIKSDYTIDYRSPISREDLVIFHHSTNSPLVKKIVSLPNEKMLIYHNITPGTFFRQFDYHFYTIFSEAERQNELLRRSNFQAIVGDSEYNLSLIKKYLPRVKVKEVLPPFLNLQFSEESEDQRIVEEINDGSFNIIFVGRFAPNKKQEDLIKIFELYSNFINENSRLILVGNYSVLDPYCSFIQSHITRREIENILIITRTSPSSLATYYKNSHLFISMSEHEGFCVPVIEALYYNVPVLAYDVPAIRELVSKKFLINKKNYSLIAEIIDELRKNDKLRQKMLKEQKKILRKFNSHKLKKNFLRVLNKTFKL